MNTRDKLIALFMRFPGIGTRQAERFVYFLLRSHPAFIDDLVGELRSLKSALTLCASCYSYFEGKEGDLCRTCSDKNVTGSLLMIVSKDIDMETVKKASLYNGKYFVLGGLLPLTEKQLPEIRLKALVERVRDRAQNNTLQEIIIALNANPEGDHTADEVRRLLSPLSKEYNFTITTLGRGLSTGTELEYSDKETIKHAMQNRH